MAGALTVRGNESIYAEGNMSRDPKAAAMVFSSGLPLVMVGLDVSLTTVITEEDLSSWKNIDSIPAEALRTMCRYYYTNEGDSAEELCGCLHDPLAAALAIRPEYILQSFPCDLMVVTEGESVGRTIRDPRYLLGGPENHTVILKVNSQAFVDEFVISIGKYLRRIQSGRTL